MAATPTRNANTGTDELTATDIANCYNEETWGGWGYLHEREMNGVRQHEQMVLGDTLLLNYANAHGWSAAELFMFVNSRIGRHYGDLVFGGFSVEKITDQSRHFFARFDFATSEGPLL